MKLQLTYSQKRPCWIAHWFKHERSWRCAVEKKREWLERSNFPRFLHQLPGALTRYKRSYPLKRSRCQHRTPVPCSDLAGVIDLEGSYYRRSSCIHRVDLSIRNFAVCPRTSAPSVLHTTQRLAFLPSQRIRPVHITVPLRIPTVPGLIEAD